MFRFKNQYFLEEMQPALETSQSFSRINWLSGKSENSLQLIPATAGKKI
jgi:hypothetical protein